MGKSHLFKATLLGIAAILVTSCAGLNIRITSRSEEPLKEYTLEGRGREKVLLIPVRGLISDAPEKSLLANRPSMVEEIVAELRKAQDDRNVKAVLLEIDSPGGSTTASDILYHEIERFKEKTSAKVVAVFMDLAASGGYYISLPSDFIVAHPTAVTGSIGVIMITPKVTGLMEKIGVAVEVNKSGSEKDIGSPFRASTPEERKILQELIGGLANRFLSLVAKHRKLDSTAMAGISTARIYSSEEALRLKLVDRIGYLDDALVDARHLAGLADDAKVIAYRRTKYPNDNVYNPSSAWDQGSGLSLVDLHIQEILPVLAPGFYYLWMPGMTEK
jgi:protease-4